MTLLWSLPPCTDSPLARRDARWLLAALAMAALCTAAIQSPLASGAALCGALILAAMARLPWRWLCSRLGAVLLFLAFFALPLPFLLDDGPGWQLGPVHLSARGLAAAVTLVCKSLALVLFAAVLLASRPVETTLKAAHSLRVPGLLVQLALLSYRYAFVLTQELRRLRIALRTRGFRNRPSRHCYRTLGHVAGTLLVRGQERAERVGQAMRCRGFDGRFRSLTQFRTQPGDVLAFISIAGIALVLWGWDLLQGARG